MAEQENMLQRYLLDEIETEQEMISQRDLLNSIRASMNIKLSQHVRWEIKVKQKVLGYTWDQIRQDRRPFLVIMEEYHENAKREEKQYIGHLLLANERVVDQYLLTRYERLYMEDDNVIFEAIGDQVIDEWLEIIPHLTEGNYEARVKIAASFEERSKAKHDRLMEALRNIEERFCTTYLGYLDSYRRAGGSLR